MPEGPEIRHHADRLRPMVGGTITSAKVLSGRHVRKPIAGFDALVGRKVRSVLRKGKLIVILLDDFTSILTTAGMSGWWTEGEPDSTFKRIQLTVGEKIFTFVDMRNFGTFKISSLEEANKKLDSLGVDVFRDDPYVMEHLRARLKKFAGDKLICEALMEQRIFAGVGNYIRADAMYTANIDPYLRADAITDEQLERLWKAIHQIAESAYVFEHNYKDLCYRREIAEDGRPVHSFVDKNKRTVWHV